MPSPAALLLLIAFTPPAEAPSSAPASALNRVLDEVSAAVEAGARPVMVFDLDSTLFDNGPRTKHILLEVAASDDALRAHAPAVAALPEVDLPYLVTDILKAARITDPTAVKGFVAGWKTRFFTDAYQTLDRPTPGAVGFVRAAHARGATVVYLTGRDAPGMGAGAVQSLRRFGLPVLTPTAVLIMKPGFSEPDETFKAKAVAMVGRLGRVIATFENEPKNANLFAVTWPEATAFFLTTNFNPQKAVPLHPTLVRIPDFQIPPPSD